MKILYSLSLIIIILISSVYYLLTNNSSLSQYKQYFLNQEIKIKINTLKAQFLGTSTILISDGNTSILTDGFITRPNLQELIFTKIKSNKELINETLLKINAKRIDAIITLHSHHDHAMDTAEVALQSDALIIGSKSTYNIVKANGAKNIKIINGKKSFLINDFKITVIPSQHTIMSKNLSLLVGLGKKIDNNFKSPSYFTNYKEGGTYSLLIEHKKGNIFINGSTNFIKNSLNNYQAQTVFLGIANLSKNTKEFQTQYFEEIIEKLNAKKVIPIHWDDFTKDINEETSTMPKIFDNFDESMKFLIKKTKENDISLVLLNIYDSINLEK